MNFIHDIKLIHTSYENANTYTEYLDISSHSLIGLSVQGVETSLLNLIKNKHLKLLINDIDIIETNNSNDISQGIVYSWIKEREMLIENCTVLENLQLATQISQGRSPQLLLKQMDIEIISEMFPRQLNYYHYFMASILSALATGARFIFIETSLVTFDDNELETIFISLKKCVDYFDRTVFIINPSPLINDRLNTKCNFSLKDE